MTRIFRLLPLALLFLLRTGALPAGDEAVRPVSGLRARDIAAQSIAPECRGNVMAILGPRVDTYVVPLDWYVWFYMPDALQAGRRVHVVGDQVRAIKEGVTEVRRLRLAPYKPEEVMAAADMCVDTPQVFATVRDIESLKGLKIVGAAFELRRSAAHGQPVWEVDVHVEREGETAKFGRVVIGARDGRVLAVQPSE